MRRTHTQCDVESSQYLRSLSGGEGNHHRTEAMRRTHTQRDVESSQYLRSLSGGEGNHHSTEAVLLSIFSTNQTNFSAVTLGQFGTSTANYQ